ncbi:hypothetical protein GP486_007332 [Trichoglossum hirsutum]|uniref:Uncharacterized protein n=1 Tax=Trichoglossum hirsutum TaxID=265104 RepID=A0A9P8IJJ3_9PEZI|nr:hypothetical protein GP486_007332 [Trichoglossum hirsutum]
MAPRDASQDPAEAPAPLEKGFATLATLRDSQLLVAKLTDSTGQDGEKRKAEILSMQERKGLPYF